MSKGTNKVKEKSCFAKWIPANESNIRLLIRNTRLLHKRKWRLTSRVDHEKLETCRATTRWAKTLVHLGHFSSFTAGKTKTWLRCQSAHLNLSRLFEDNYCFEQRQQTFSHLVCEMLGVCVCEYTDGSQMYLPVWDTCLCFVADVNECEHEAGVCPPRQTCRNTFGSFICVCQGGLVLGTLGGSVECRGTTLQTCRLLLLLWDRKLPQSHLFLSKKIYSLHMCELMWRCDKVWQNK